MRLIGLAGVMIVAGALAGCAVGWPISQSEIGSPQPNAARLVVYRPSGAMLAWRSFDVDVNGAPACSLSRGAGFATDVGTGEVTVAVHLYAVGAGSLAFTAEGGKTYFVRVRVAGETAPGVKGGLIGLGSEAAPGGSGQFELASTNETEAIASGVKLAQCSP